MLFPPIRYETNIIFPPLYAGTCQISPLNGINIFHSNNITYYSNNSMLYIMIMKIIMI